MLSDYSLLAPGPVNLHPEVRRILSLPMIHHRTPEFDQILKSVLTDLPFIFQTKQKVYLHTSTGSGGMESLLINVLNSGDKVLAIDSGKFGERWAEMAQVYGARVTVLKVPWGKAVAPSEVEAHLSQHPDTALVLCQACETSTGVVHPIAELGDIIRKYPETLFLVDGITALGALPLPMDEWHIDGLVAGSQKAFMLPTGLSFICFSEKAWKKIPQVKTPRYYFDITREKKANDKGETFFSSNVSLTRALDWFLQDLKNKGLAKHFAEIHRRAEMVRLFSQKLGFTLYAEAPSDSVTALRVPDHLDGQQIRQHLEDHFHITIMGGQDQAKGKIIRIGHMGYIQDSELLRLIRSLGLTLQTMDPAFLSREQVESVTHDAQLWLERHPL
ncbi:MAG: pyridoxal-phosphate-dependent aminotransferase family protein [Bdellovibrionia bacterium]